MTPGRRTPKQRETKDFAIDRDGSVVVVSTGRGYMKRSNAVLRLMTGDLDCRGGPGTETSSRRDQLASTWGVLRVAGVCYGLDTSRHAGFVVELISSHTPKNFF